MEDQQARRARLALIRAAMPGVQRMVADYRRELGDDWVTDCVRRGMAGEPGWFFAREGALAVGTPWPTDDGVMSNWAAAQVTATQALVLIRTPEVTHGTN